MINKTVSSIFFVPTLKINRDKLTALDNNFINGYIKDLQREEQYKDSIYLLFKPKNLDKFKDFVDSEYTRTEFIIDDYNYGDFVVLVYNLNPLYMDDFRTIMKGQYSKTSKSFQKLFPEEISIVKVDQYGQSYFGREQSLQFRIFNKTEDLRKYWEDRINVRFQDEMEVWSSWKEEDEIMNIEEIKKLI